MPEKFIFKQGEVGKRCTWTLTDADDAAVDLTAYTITLNAKKGDTETITEASVTKATQSGATLGQCYHNLTSTTAAIAVGNHKGELKLVNGSTVLYWPVQDDPRESYFVWEVQTPIDA
jgi:hypothetical protein